MRVGAVILAGGESQRMGRDKAWLEWGGQTLISRGITTVRALGITEIFVSGRAGVDYSSERLPVLLDQEPGGGPLGGIAAALAVVTSPLLLVLPVDLPKMSPEFLRRLAGKCGEDFGAVPTLNGGLEPLVAVYPQRSEVIVRDCLAHNIRSARAFAEACLRADLVRRVEVSEGDAGCFENWNSPSDLRNGPADM